MYFFFFAVLYLSFISQMKTGFVAFYDHTSIIVSYSKKKKNSHLNLHFLKNGFLFSFMSTAWILQAFKSVSPVLHIIIYLVFLEE